MKKTLSVFLVLLLVPCLVTAQSSFKYKITPDDPGWKNLTVPQMKEVLKIPVSTLKRMSTEEVMQAWFDYPFFYEITARGTYQTSFDRQSAECSALQELLTRNDLPAVLLKLYKDVYDPENIYKKWDTEGLLQKGIFIRNGMILDVLATQDVVLNKFSKGQKKQLMAVCRDKVFKHREYSSRIYSPEWNNSNFYLITKFLKHENDNVALQMLSSDIKLQQHIQRGYPVRFALQTENRLLQSLQNYLNIH